MEDDPVLADKSESLKQALTTVAKLSADRMSALEEAAPLSAHFHETHGDLLTWFEEMEVEMEKLSSGPALDTEEIKVG